MAAIDDLKTARTRIAARIKDSLENPKPTYSLDGESYDHAGYLDMLFRNLENLQKAIQRAGAPFAKTMRGRS